MAKRAPSFACQSCGAVYQRWQGKCEACGEWNTHRRGGRPPPASAALAARGARKGPHLRAGRAVRRIQATRRACLSGIGGARPRHRRRLRARLRDPDRRRSGHRQVDAADAGLRRAGANKASGSSTSPARRRRRRCGCAPSGSGCPTPPVELAAETNVEDIIATLSAGRPPALVVIDSIQTMWTETVDAAPGTVTQVRGAAQALIRFAKTPAPASSSSATSPRTARSPARAWSSTWSTPSSRSRATARTISASCAP